MKTIRPGRGEGKPMKGRCMFCGCRIECLASDCKWMQDDRPGDGTGAHYVDCPTCGKPVYPRPARKG